MQTEIEFPDEVSTEARTNMRARSMRLRKLLGAIADNGPDLAEHTLVARYAIQNNISSSTAVTYLHELLDAEYVFRCDGHVVTLVDYEKLLKKSMKASNKSDK